MRYKNANKLIEIIETELQSSYDYIKDYCNNLKINNNDILINNYIIILKYKINELFKIIDSLIKGTCSHNYTTKYDINIKNNIISEIDAERITKPLIYNIKKLIYISNNKDININDIDMYITRNLQIKDILFDNIEGYIPLSTNQKKELIKKKKLETNNTLQLIKHKR